MMKKILKKEVIIAFIIGIILAGGIVYAVVSASEIEYKDGKSVADALNDLYKNKTDTSDTEVEITQNGQQTLDKYYKNLNVNVTQTSNIEESTIITSASLNDISRTQTSIQGNVQLTTDNSSNTFIYIIYLTNKSSGQTIIKSFSTSTFTINNLYNSTEYSLYAVVSDIYGKFKKTDSVETSTLSGPALVIDSVNNIYSNGSGNVSVETIRNVLFDGSKTKLGAYGSALYSTTQSYIQFTVNTRLKLYAYGGYYSDSGGTTGKVAIFKKYVNNQYVECSRTTTNHNGTRYELATLDPGVYRIYFNEKYIEFDEWEVVAL